MNFVIRILDLIILFQANILLLLRNNFFTNVVMAAWVLGRDVFIEDDLFNCFKWCMLALPI